MQLQGRGTGHTLLAQVSTSAPCLLQPNAFNLSSTQRCTVAAAAPKGLAFLSDILRDFSRHFERGPKATCDCISYSYCNCSSCEIQPCSCSHVQHQMEWGLFGGIIVHDSHDPYRQARPIECIQTIDHKAFVVGCKKKNHNLPSAKLQAQYAALRSGLTSQFLQEPKSDGSIQDICAHCDVNELQQERELSRAM